MSTIGRFFKEGDIYSGSITTLTVILKKVSIRPNTRKGGGTKQPDFLVFSGPAEFGAAWSKKSEFNAKPFLSVRLNDPSWPNPINANLVEGGTEDSAPDGDGVTKPIQIYELNWNG